MGRRDLKFVMKYIFARQHYTEIYLLKFFNVLEYRYVYHNFEIQWYTEYSVSGNCVDGQYAILIKTFQSFLVGTL